MVATFPMGWARTWWQNPRSALSFPVQPRISSQARLVDQPNSLRAILSTQSKCVFSSQVQSVCMWAQWTVCARPSLLMGCSVSSRECHLRSWALLLSMPCSLCRMDMRVAGSSKNARITTLTLASVLQNLLWQACLPV